MRATLLLFASVLLMPASVMAQGWDVYISNEDGFRVNFPGPPTVTETTFASEYGIALPARVHTVVRGPERYSITVVDYRDILRLADERATATCPEGYADERACGLNNAGRGYWREEVGGALLWATFGYVERDAVVTHLAWAWQDLVEGHEIQLTNNADRSRTFAFVSMHQNRLYILEGTVPGNRPPPGLFQQSMGYVEPDGTPVRYQTVYSNRSSEFPETFPGQALRTRRGGGAAAPAAAP
ncbi:MAG: hypothetical protein O2930_12750 [Acidobacteria bacterium]|nr:hypothetical protein [Acidobacteriota bacterium]